VGNEAIVSDILKLGIRWVVSLMRRPPYTRGKSPQYPLGRGPETPECPGAVETKIISCPYWEPNPNSSVRRPIVRRHMGWIIPILKINLSVKNDTEKCEHSLIPRVGFEAAVPLFVKSQIALGPRGHAVQLWCIHLGTSVLRNLTLFEYLPNFGKSLIVKYQ
jgi:hypothetical protein